MIKINVEKVKSYEFEGTVNVDDLPKDILDILRIDPVKHEGETLEVLGDFGVYASEDEASIDEMNITIYGAKNGLKHKAPIGQVTDLTEPIRTLRTIWGEVESQHSVDIDQDDRFDLENVCDQILDMSDTYDWYMDRCMGEADRLYDSWKEGEY